MPNFRIKKENKNKSWPYIKTADKLSFLDDKVNVDYNLFDLVGESIYSAYQGNKVFKDVLDKSRLNIDVDLGKGFGLNLNKNRRDYNLTLSKDIY